MRIFPKKNLKNNMRNYICDRKSKKEFMKWKTDFWQSQQEKQ